MAFWLYPWVRVAQGLADAVWGLLQPVAVRVFTKLNQQLSYQLVHRSNPLMPAARMRWLEGSTLEMQLGLQRWRYGVEDLVQDGVYCGAVSGTTLPCRHYAVVGNWQKQRLHVIRRGKTAA
jgi:hypothetical protein